MLPRCPSLDGPFVRQSDTLCLPGLETLPLHRVCFDPAAFSPECFGAQGIILPASLQGLPQAPRGVSGRASRSP